MAEVTDLVLEKKLRDAADYLAEGHIAPELIGVVLDRIIEEHHAAVEATEA